MTTAGPPADAGGHADALAGPMHDLWHSSQDQLRRQIAALDAAALAGLEQRLSPDERERAEREATALADSLRAFGLADGARQARDVAWLLQGQRSLGPNDYLRLSELVVGIEQEFTRGPRPTDAPAATGPVLLIVEPDPALGRRLVEEATAAGLRAEWVESAAGARDRLDHQRPDLVLLEPNDPAEGGLSLLEELGQGPYAVPTLVVTVRGGKVDRVEVARLGGLGFLEKPLSARTIVDIARHTLDRRRSQATLLAMGDGAEAVTALRQALESQGWRVEPLTDPGRLWSALGTVRPELLVIDADPAYHDPAELCRIVRNDPAWGRLPIVCLTSATRDRHRELFRAGADDVVLTPLDGAELAERVANRLQRSRLGAAQGGEDPRTGLPAWPQFEVELRRQIVMCRRYGQPLALVALAVDDEPELDARYGEPAGESARAALARLLRRSFRIEDALGARGDQHLLAAMYGAEPAGSLNRINRLVESFRDVPVGYEDHEGSATASAGVAMYPGDGTTVGELSAAAFAALQRAHGDGGDRVYTAGTEQVADLRTVEVLLVDDDATLAPLLRRSLELHGYEVEWLRDGADALQRLLAPDGLRARVLLLDIDLPGLDGMSVLRELARGGHLEKMRVIMVTVRAVETGVLQALDLGAFDYVAKPLSVPLLIYRVRRALDSIRT